MPGEGPLRSGELPDGRSFELIPGSPEFGEERIALIEADGGRREIALHDYADVYDVPGLYEGVVQRALLCQSPQMTAAGAAAAVTDLGLSPAAMRVLDIGAGNGVVGGQLAERGFDHIFGTDLLPEAERATGRDRAGVYERYLAGDLTDPTDPLQAEIAAWQPSLITCAGALGGGHMSALALTNTFATLADPAVVVLTIAEGRLEETNEDGFGALLAEGLADGSLEELHRERFRHRFSMAGDPVYYFVLTLRVAR